MAENDLSETTGTAPLPSPRPALDDTVDDTAGTTVGFPWPEPWRRIGAARPRTTFWDVESAGWRSGPAG